MSLASQPNGRAFVHSFLRTLLVGAAFNTRGMQNIGLSYAMDPGLKAIYGSLEPGQPDGPDGPEQPDMEWAGEAPEGGDASTMLGQARRRYVRHYNTHPYFTPLLVGVFLSLEMRVRKGELPPAMLDQVKTTTAYTLSALGDSFFGGSLVVLWTLVGCHLVVAGREAVALGWVLAYPLGVAAFRAATFVAGLREGLGVLQRLKRLGLIDWSGRIKVVNALLVALLWLAAWPAAVPGWAWLGGVAGIGGFSYLVYRAGYLREAVALVALGAYILAPWIDKISLD